jgi:hypothetical protein
LPTTDFLFPSRYLSPALEAWAAWLILAVQSCSRLIPAHRLLAGLTLLGLLLTPYQLAAFDVDKEGHYEMMVAALALELGIEDRVQIDAFYPGDRSNLILERTRMAVERNWSVFGHPLIEDVAARLETQFDDTAYGMRCTGVLQQVSVLPRESRFLKVEGWLFDAERREVPSRVWLTEPGGRIVGYALTGMAHPELPAGIRNAGFKGYMLSAYSDHFLTLIGSEPDCGLELSSPASKSS